MLISKGITMKPILLIFIVLISSQVSAGAKFIPADHKHFLYTGRIDFSQPKSPFLSWAGSSIKANFTGTSLAILLNDENGENFYTVIIDGDDSSPFVLKAVQGESKYLISQSLAPTKHSVEIYKRTEGQEGGSYFKGIEIDADSSMLPPPLRPSRRIEIYGDSISSGMGNEAADNAEDNLASEKNNYWAYGSIAARELNAELHTISQSGIGVMVSWFDFTMPDFFDQLSAVGNNDSQWNFQKWLPDVVVINLMQNDSWLVEDRLSPVPSHRQRIQHYQNFVVTIRQQYPDALIICALGSMDATRDKQWPNYIRQAVNNLQQLGDDNIDFLSFDYTGYDKHPRIAQHKQNAAKLTEFVRSKMNW